MRSFSVYLWVAILLLANTGIAYAGRETALKGAKTQTNRESELAALKRLLAQPEGSIDLAQAKVAIDRMVDPKTDVQGTLRSLDQWAAKVRARFPAGASNKAKIELLVSTLTEPGPWNDYRPFGYDFEDPFGKDTRRTLLANYLKTRKGQCVIMPIMVVLLGQKLGLPVTMTTAPYHLIAKYGDEEKGEWMNLEATSGRSYYDSDYIRSLSIPPEALKQDTFLRPYTQRETVALFATATLAQFYKQQHQPELALRVTELILEANPKDAVAMTIRGDAYYQLIEQQFKSKYPVAAQIPPTMRAQYQSYSQENHAWYAKAEALGWKEWTKEQWNSYIARLRKEQPINQAGSKK